MKMDSRLGKCLGVLAACFGVLAASPSSAAAQIKEPGRHPMYSVELEPHLVIHWDRGWHTRGTGAGPGLRVSIPIVKSGPIPQINNSLAIGLGADWAYFSACDGQPNSASCHVSEFWFPVVAQWNFYFTPVISVFGEVGGALVSRRFGYDRGCPAIDAADCRYNTFDVFEPLFYGGGRFQFSQTVGMILRVGSPSFTIGANFLL
ncbi:MAG: hypothetical protein ACOY0T_13780 [Myxococcota bacterium]